MREWLKNHRKQKGFTMKEIGAKLGVSESYYCAIESGSRKTQLSLGMVVKLSRILGITVEQIADYESDQCEQVAG